MNTLQRIRRIIVDLYQNFWLFVGVIAVFAVFIALIAIEIIALWNCSFGEWILYGKNLPWAYYWGYCKG